MLKNAIPSQEFILAILKGYEEELAENGFPNPAHIWNRVVMRCINERIPFETLFSWDKSASNRKNRVRDIAECIERGWVPRLKLAKDSKGREIIVATP